VHPGAPGQHGAVPKDLHDGQRPTTAVERLVAAPPAAVWPVVVDPDRHDELSAWRLADLRRDVQAVLDGVAAPCAPGAGGATAGGR
jgi:hypothetical protein